MANSPDRRCGECSLCCKLLPVRELNKGAGHRCKHQRMSKGCAIYARRPSSCHIWSCAWLADIDTADLSRPDRAHYVIDIMPDFVTVKDETGSGQPDQQVPVVQIWIDPRYPDAHRDPALRDFLKRRGDEGMVALIRYDSEKAIVLVPPQMSSTGDFYEHDSGMATVQQHTPAEIAKAVYGRKDEAA